MKRHAPLFLAFFVCSQIFSQSKSWNEWQTDFNQEIFGEFTYKNHTDLSARIATVMKSNDASGFYWEGFSYINGLLHAWMASGDFKYLDVLLDIIEEDIENAVLISEVQENQSERDWQFKANLVKKNFFYQEVVVENSLNQFYLPLDQYARNANKDVYGYGNRTLFNGTPEGTYIALDEGMYWRNVSNVARVLHNNKSVWNFPSNNGETYKERLDKVVNFLINQVWARNFKNPDATRNHWGKYIYRLNTHMASHLAMNALCLYAITGEQEYRDFVEEYLFDFKKNEKATESYLTEGQGLMDKMRFQSDGTIQWTSKWDEENKAQDIDHAVAEFQLLEACFQEGVGINPPNGDRPVDRALMEALARTIQVKILNNHECGNQAGRSAFRLDGTGYSYGLSSATTLFAAYNPNLLCYVEQRPSGQIDKKIGNMGAAMYISRILRVNDQDGPAYTHQGDDTGFSEDNFTPPSITQPELMQIAPNPARPGQEVVIGEVPDGEFNIRVLSLYGQALASTNINNSNSKYISYIVPDHIPQGLYLIQVHGINFSQTKKIQVLP